MKKASVKLLGKIALILVACIVFAAFFACKEEEAEPTPVPTPEPTHKEPDLSPIYNIDYDPEQFIVTGSTLTEYIGSGGDVEIPNDITVIGPNAFAGASGVTSVTFPRTVTYIDSHAFEGCTGLKGPFTPPKFVTYVGDYAFKDCTGITEIAFENRLDGFGEHVFEGCTGLVKATLPEKFILAGATTVLPAYTFSGCSSLTDVTIFKEAVDIGDGAFENCTSLAAVTIPDKVKTMGKNVFAGCSSLSEITFSKILYLVGGGSLNDTPWYTAKMNEAKAAVAAAATDDEKMAAGFVTVGQNAVVGFVPASDSGNVEIRLPETVYSLNEGTFAPFIERLTKLEYTTSSRLEFLGDNLFKGAVNLKEISLPSKLKTISEGLFDGCTGLETVNITSRLTSIGDNAFRECVALKEIYLPDDIKSIGNSAFFHCTSLTDIIFPSSIEDIGDYAFKDCENISNFIFTLKLSNVGVQAFDNTKWYDDLSASDEPLTENRFHVFGNGVLIKADIVDENVVIPDNVKSIGAFTFNGWKEIKDREFYGSKLPKSITIPDGVTRIGDYAFYFCENLDTVFIADTVTEIGEKAFYGCSNITSVHIPDGVTEIGDYTFYGCTKLTEVRLPEGLTSIGRYAFYNCDALTTLEIPASVSKVGAFAFTGTPWFDFHNEKLFMIGDTLVKYNGESHAVLPDSVLSICGGAFENESTVSVTLPAAMTTIPEYAFSGCVNLKEIGLDNVTAIEERAFNGCKALTATVDTSAVNVAPDAFTNCPNVVLK
ncbi:MAG: leucine-rich repeat domain-containing protein [Clostridia bacterium]|nr:leucine-rich repeat domain-containing protein [Clostridia bacterium]MBQ3867819.1 leucine-rich repeat domain-containing protein [Clostridia bacterium]